MLTPCILCNARHLAKIDNKAVPRCFTECWHKGNAQIVDELGADDLVFSYRLHGELHGREPKLIFRIF